MPNAVYVDYQQRRFDAYFTADFQHKHLRPLMPVPVGDFEASRSRAREGNVSLVQRNQRFDSVAMNSLIFDFDPLHRVRQIQLLMEEVAQRNADGDYTRRPPGEKLTTRDEYYVQITEPGSRNDFVRGAVLYKVLNINGRYIINHFGGVSR